MYKKSLSIILSAIIAILSINCSFLAFAQDFTTEITRDGEIVTAVIEIEESERITLSYTTDSDLPEGITTQWSSNYPLLASVNENGVVTGHDCSKSAMLTLWIDNEIRPIPLIGNSLGNTLQASFNAAGVDSMSTEEIVSLVETVTGSTNYSDSLREYLNSPIKITLVIKNSNGEIISSDTAQFIVNKSSAVYADLVPNATHITNKKLLPSTVAVGYSTTLIGVVTPTRLDMDVVWSVDNSDVATIDENGNIEFIGTGTVTAKASPDSSAVTENLLKLINLVGKNSDGTINYDRISEVLALAFGLSDSEKTALATALKLALVLDSDGNITFRGGSTVTTLLNLLYKNTTFDSFTFSVVSPSELPLESFTLNTTTSITEGQTAPLEISNVLPDGASIKDVHFDSSDETVVKINSDSTITGVDAGGYRLINNYSKQATVTAKIGDISSNVNVTVKGKNNVLSSVSLSGASDIALGDTVTYTATPYPVRMQKNTTITWGIYDENSNIIWADSSSSASNGYASINNLGQLTGISDTTVNIIVKATYSSYELTDTMSVKIGNAIESFELIPLASTVYEGDSTVFSITNIQPSTAVISNINWSISDSSVATIEDGTFFAYDTGSYLPNATKKVTVSATISGITKTYIVTVARTTTSKITDISVTGDTTIQVDLTNTYSTTIKPARINNVATTISWGVKIGGTVEYATANSSVQNEYIFVDNSGNVTAKMAGNTTLYVKGTYLNVSYIKEVPLSLYEQAPDNFSFVKPSNVEYEKGVTILDMADAYFKLTYGEKTVNVTDYIVSNIDYTLYDKSQTVTVFLYRDSKLIESSFDIIINRPNDINALGSNIRVGNSAGLRFVFNLDKSVINTESSNITYGFIYSYSESSRDKLSVENSLTDSSIKNKVATNYVDDGSLINFNLVFKNIPKSAYNTYITARAYVCVDNEYYYSDIICRNFNNVANTILNDDEIDDSTKNAITDLLNKE